MNPKRPLLVPANLLMSVVHRVGCISARPPITDYKYTLGLTGNRTGATEQGGRTLNWNYDGIYRLTNVTISISGPGRMDNLLKDHKRNISRGCPCPHLTRYPPASYSN